MTQRGGYGISLTCSLGLKSADGNHVLCYAERVAAQQCCGSLASVASTDGGRALPYLPTRNRQEDWSTDVRPHVSESQQPQRLVDQQVWIRQRVRCNRTEPALPVDLSDRHETTSQLATNPFQ